MTEMRMICYVCNMRGEVEPLIACVDVTEDGDRRWFWYCRKCEEQNGWGVSLAAPFDLDLVRMTPPNPDNDFEVFGLYGPVAILPEPQ